MQTKGKDRSLDGEVEKAAERGLYGRPITVVTASICAPADTDECTITMKADTSFIKTACEKVHISGPASLPCRT